MSTQIQAAGFSAVKIPLTGVMFRYVAHGRVVETAAGGELWRFTGWFGDPYTDGTMLVVSEKADPEQALTDMIKLLAQCVAPPEPTSREEAWGVDDWYSTPNGFD